MIFIKVLLTAVIIFSCIAVALMAANIITDFKIKWLDSITDYVITIYIPIAVALFIAAVILVIYAIWTQM